MGIDNLDSIYDGLIAQMQATAEQKVADGGLDEKEYAHFIRYLGRALHVLQCMENSTKDGAEHTKQECIEPYYKLLYSTVADATIKALTVTDTVQEELIKLVQISDTVDKIEHADKHRCMNVIWQLKEAAVSSGQSYNLERSIEDVHQEDFDPVVATIVANSVNQAEIDAAIAFNLANTSELRSTDMPVYGCSNLGMTWEPEFNRDRILDLLKKRIDVSANEKSCYPLPAKDYFHHRWPARDICFYNFHDHDSCNCTCEHEIKHKAAAEQDYSWKRLYC